VKNNLRLVRCDGLLFELIARLRRSRIALLICAIVPMALSFLLIDGCSKSNGPTAPPTPSLLQGNQAFHAGAVAGYQAVGAGVSYPFTALQLASPTGSTIRSLSVTNLFSHSSGFTTLMRTSKITDTLSFVPYLNLYGGDRFNGNVLTLFFYSDATGTQSAGNVTVTLPPNTTDPLDPTSYASYPANVTIAINITAGNLPCTGNLVVSFTGGTGANTMTGTNTLTKDNVVFSLNLTLDNQFNVSGSVTITESGATIEATNVKGRLDGSLTCDVKINPYGWTGTGILNLVKGSMTASVNTGTGTSTATSDSLGSVNINYADGTHEIVVNALSGGLTSTSSTPASITATSGSSQSAAINTAFSSPLIATVKDQSSNPVSGATVTFTAPSSGQSCTFTGGVTTITTTTNAQGQAQVSITANATAGNYNVTASVAGVATTATFSLTNISGSSNAGYNEPLFYTNSQRTIVTINNNGQSVGYLPPPAGSSYNVPVYWSTPTSQPQTLQISVNDSSDDINGFNDNGQIIGNGFYYYPNGQQRPTNPIYWSSPTAKPQKLTVPNDMQYAIATGINNSGQIVGWALTPSNTITALYWASDTSQPQVLQSLAGSRITPSFIGPNGQIIAGITSSYESGNNLAVWSSPTAQPVVLKGLTGAILVIPLSVNASGLIVGYSQDKNGQTPVTWAGVNASPQALPLPYTPSNLGITIAASINTVGVIVGSISNDVGGGQCLIWKNGQVHDLADLINNYALGPARLITDQGWILGTAYYGYNQYILIPK
jgi:hypothetical protein